MEETYRKVFIKTEADYPKENGLYFCVDQNRHYIGERSFDKADKINLHIWSGVNWYLQPVTAKTEQECKHTDSTVRYGIKQCADCGKPFSEQEKPSEQPQEEHTIDEEKILTLFAKHSNCLGKSPVRLPCMTRSAFVMAIREYASQKHNNRIVDVSLLRDAWSECWGAAARAGYSIGKMQIEFENWLDSRKIKWR